MNKNLVEFKRRLQLKESKGEYLYQFALSATIVGNEITMKFTQAYDVDLAYILRLAKRLGLNVKLEAHEDEYQGDVDAEASVLVKVY